MKEKNIQELAIRMGLITVEDMCQYTIAQLVVKIANKVNELVDEVWRFETDVQEIVKTQNEKIQYLLGEGLHLEVENIFDGWVQDGTFDTLINQSALKKVNDRIDETNAQLSDISNNQLKFVTYEMFGAKSDGVYDDGIAIKKAHEYANLHGLPVINTKGEYWINSNRNIPIRTNVDLGMSKFHINDKYINEPIFIIKPKQDEFLLKDNSIYNQVLPFLKKGSTPTIELLKLYKNHFVRFVDENNLVYARYSSKGATNGTAMQDVCYIDNDGKIIGEITWNFTGLTHIYLTPIDDFNLKFENGTFLMSGDSDESIESLAGTYRKGIIVCERSRTKIDNIFIGFDEGKEDNNTIGCSGLIRIYNCYDIQLNNIKLPALKDIGSSYGLNFENVVNLNLKHVHGSGTSDKWGIVGGNFIKDAIIEDCMLNRFDSHKHAWNLHFKNCVIGLESFSIIGGGKLIIDDTICEGSKFLPFRRDYGCIWNGDILLKRCKLKPLSDFDSDTVPMIFDFTTPNFDYKMDVIHGIDIKVEDFIIDYSNISANNPFPQLFSSSVSTTNPWTQDYLVGDRYYLPKSLKFKDVKIVAPYELTGDKTAMIYIRQLTQARMKTKGDKDLLQTNMIIELDNCEAPNYKVLLQNHANGYIRFQDTKEYSTHEYTPIPKIVIKNCESVKVNVEGFPCYLKVENSDICAIKLTKTDDVSATDAQGFAEFINCDLKVNSTSTVYGTGARTAFYLNNGKNCKLYNCHLSHPIIDGMKTTNKNHVSRAFGSSIIDLTSTTKSIKTNLIGLTLDDSLYTLLNLTPIQRNVIYQGAIYSDSGVEI